MRTATLSPGDIEELTRLEEGMWRAELRYNATFQAERFAPDFFEFGRSGRVYSREEAILDKPEPIHAALPLRNLQIRALDVDTVQLTYYSEVQYGTETEYARRSSIWSRTDRGWVMRFHQGTPYSPGGHADEG